MARELVVRLIGDDASLHRSFVRSSKDAANFNRNLSRSARGVVAATVSFRGLGRALAFGSNAFIGGAGAVFAVKAFSEAASNMAEQTSKANVVFGASTRIVQNFANNALGLARDEALQTASTFGALLHPLGLTGDAAANASVKLTQLGIDFASFFNTDVTDALAAINSGLVGEVEPLRRYGVLLSQARVQQEALSESGKKSVKQLTNQELVQARIALIFRDSSQAQGDFARTQGGLANQQRLLAQNVRNLEISLGTALNPTILSVTKSLNKWLSNSENQAKVTHDLKEVIGGAAAALQTFRDVIDTVDRITGSLANTIKLLLEIKVASIVLGWARAMNLFAAAEVAANESAVVSRINAYTGAVAGTGAAAATSAKQVGGLKGALSGLGLIQIAPILIPIEVDIIEREKGLLDKLGRAGSVGKGLLDIATGSATGNIISDAKEAILGKKRPSKREDTSVSATQGLGPHSAAVIAKQAKAAVAAADKAVKKTGVTAEQKNTFFDNTIARILLRSSLGDIDQQISGLQKADALIAKRIKVTKDVTRKQNLEDELLQNQAQISDLRAQQAAEVAQKAADAAQKRQDAVDKFIGALQFNVTKAQATTGLNDDIAALKALQAGIKKEISELGSTADLQQQLFDVQQQIVDARKQQKQNALEALTARQFQQLGLTSTGDERTPLVSGLKKRLAQLTANVSSSSLNTPRLQSELARFRKVLSEGLVPRDVRSKIKDMMDEIADELKNTGRRNLTKFRRVSNDALLAGLGLSPDQVRELRSRMAQVGAGGTVPGVRSQAFALAGGQTHTIVVPVSIEGREVAKAVTGPLQRYQLQRSGARRGPYAGRH